MARITVRNVDDAHYAALKALAKANNRSVSAELRAIIADAVRKFREDNVPAA
jgi:plasmid stability protein